MVKLISASMWPLQGRLNTDLGRAAWVVILLICYPGVQGLGVGWSFGIQVEIVLCINKFDDTGY